MKSQVPLFWELLSITDQDEYLKVRQSIAPKGTRIQRAKSISMFKNALNSIKLFVQKGEEDDWRRSIVCGIFWLNQDIVGINSSQLSFLMGKGKSSINEGFREIGFVTLRPSTEMTQILMSQFSIISKNKAEARKWSFHEIPKQNRLISSFNSSDILSIPKTQSTLPPATEVQQKMASNEHFLLCDNNIDMKTSYLLNEQDDAFDMEFEDFTWNTLTY